MVNLNGYMPSTSSPIFSPNIPSKRLRQGTTSPTRTRWPRNLPNTSPNHHQPLLRTHNFINRQMNQLGNPSQHLLNNCPLPPTIHQHLQRHSMPSFLQQPTPAHIANNSPSTSPPPPSPPINQQPPPPCTFLNSPQHPMQHHHYQRTPTSPRIQHRPSN